MKIYIPLLYFVFVSCSSPGQDANRLIRQIDGQLAKRQTSISKVLSDTAFMFLHPLTEFREVIKRHAKTEKVTMVSPVEPGKKIKVDGSNYQRQSESIE